MYQFSTAQELLAICSRESKNIAEIVILSEVEATGKERDLIRSKMEGHFKVMQESIKNGLSPDIKSLGGLIGGNAYRLHQHMQKNCVSGQTVVKAAICPGGD
jgi:L-serine dehydratase